MDHIALSRGADLIVVAPASADFLAKLAHGNADDLLSTLCLARECPLLVAPAMNVQMWLNAATQRNVAQLRTDGVVILGPDAGDEAGGEVGDGRMIEAQAIFDAVVASRTPKVLDGKRVLVTAGGTREAVDAVRFVGNRSSGRMGVALAEEAQRRGAEVTLIASNLTVVPPDGIEIVQAPTAADVQRETTSHAGADVVLMAAAVGDYRPAQTDAAKRPKDEKTWQIELEPTADVLRGLGESRKNGQVLVGFAAETAANGLERARKKLSNKQVDLIVYNDVSRDDVGFDAKENEVVIVSAQGERRVEKAPKEAIAAAILDEVEHLI
jgi:phosphopantothenoylcysteine decarboxylase/phosphopantothenate--cysteine ligase